MVKEFPGVKAAIIAMVKRRADVSNLVKFNYLIKYFYFIFFYKFLV